MTETSVPTPKPSLRHSPPLLPPLLAFGLLFLLTDFARPFAVPDEARYVGIAMEMARTNDFLTPFLNGIKYFEKPPLLYWLQGLIFKIFPARYLLADNLPLLHLVGRLGVGLFALGGVMVVYGGLWALLPTFSPTASRSLRLRLAWQGAWITATAFVYFVMGRLITLDMGLSFTISLCLMAFLLAHRQDPGRRRRLLMYTATLGAALAVLAKGLIGVVMPGLIILTWLTFTRRWRCLFPVYLPTCILLFCALVIPWHALVQLRHPEFGWFYFVHEHFLRYTTTIHRRDGPWWMGLAVLTIGFLPWMGSFWSRLISQLPGVVRISKALDHVSQNSLAATKLYFLVWAGWIVTFFSFSSSKLIPYFLPAVPAMACWLALEWYHEQEQKKDNDRGIKWDYGFQIVTFATLTFIAAGMAAAPIVSSGAYGSLRPPEQTNTLMALGFIFGVFAIMFTVWLRRFCRHSVSGVSRASQFSQESRASQSPAQPEAQPLIHGAKRHAFFARTAVVGVIMNFSLMILGPVFQRPSVQDAATFMAQKDLDAAYQLGFFIYDMPVYYGQPSPVMTAALGELEYGWAHHQGQPMILSYGEFPLVWQQGIKLGRRQCAVMRTRDGPSYQTAYEHELYKDFGHYSVICTGL